MLTLFNEKAAGSDLALIEGNRGLYDGKDVGGSCSTAELSRWLQAPVALVIDCTKMTRTVAAIVQGCAAFEPDVQLAGVILNRTAGERHRAILRQAIEQYTDIAVIGSLPKLKRNPIPERHMGLWSDRELDGQGEESLGALGRIVSDCLDLHHLEELARGACALELPDTALWPVPEPGETPVIGYVHDAALWFYYPENLEALERAGARLVRLSLLDDAPWPDIHGLYLGGGFPETLAPQLSANVSVRGRVRALAEAGMPMYAECGGFMYLCERIEYEDRMHDMAGLFPLETGFCARPQGLGYTEAEVLEDTPFFSAGEVVHGHEFHYSRCAKPSSAELHLTLRMRRGNGLLQGMDGLVYKNVLAGYNHIFALGTPQWAPNFVRAARSYRLSLSATTGDHE